MNNVLLIAIYPIVSLLRTASWRATPATETQKAFLYKRWSRHNPNASEEEKAVKQGKLAKLTKGDAATIITRLQHGAQVQFYIF